ncbi:hypothetical protein NW763_011479 [Fusarium oxysporum]|nr:hypothetical protein NW763_011479 [Fusarium oxysporum]
MEAAGLAVGVVGLAGLFNSCLESLAKVQTYRSSNTDSHVLDTRFRAARARFEQWGVKVGISQGKLLPDHHSELRDKDTARVIGDIFHIIAKTICDDADSHVISDPQPYSGTHHGFPQPYSGTHHGFPQSKRKRLKWTFGGKEERVEQVDIFEKLVQQLHNLISPNEKSEKETGDFQSQVWSDDIRNILLKIEERWKAGMKRDVYSWLGKSLPNDKYEDSLNKRVDTTCDWIFDRPAFTSWLSLGDQCKPRLLWINAPAGFGKTILCAYIIQHLSNILTTPIGHFFFTSDLDSREDPYLALRSWISQVAAHSNDAFEYIRKAREADTAELASQRTINNLFTALVDEIPGCTFIADGLDECSQLSKGETSVAKFLTDITSTVSASNARLLFVSRDEPEIRDALEENAAQFLTEYRILAEDVRSDTVAFSQSMVDRKLSNKSDDIRAAISEAMAERCQGQFLWIKMQEESLRKGMSKKRLHEVVEKTPSGLARLYDHNWKRIMEMSEWERDRAFSLLRWTAFSKRPLNVYEITEAVLITQFEELDIDEFPDSVDNDYIRTEILGLCGPLLEVKDHPESSSPGYRSVHIPHFSVRQYLCQKLPVPSWIQHNSQLQTSYEKAHHTIIAKACIQYISLPQVWTDGFDPASQGETLRFYAATSWLTHTGLSFQDSTIIGLSMALLDEHNTSYRSLAEYLTEVTQWVNKYAGKGRPLKPLEYVLRHKWVNMAKLLVTEAIPNPKDVLGRSPMFLACSTGMTEVVDKCLQFGVDPTVADTWGRTPLHLAASFGSEDVIKTLIKHGADLTAQDEDGFTPLHLASRYCHVRSCEHLIEKAASLTIKNNRGSTLLHLACIRGQSQAARLILQNGPQTMVADVHPVVGSPLHCACMSGDVETTNVLLEHGAAASIYVSDSMGRSPLAVATTYSHVALVKLLLDHGAASTLATTDHDDRTPLHIATGFAAPNDAIIELLLRPEGKASMLMADYYGRIPLFLASQDGNTNAVKLLLEYQVPNLQPMLEARDKDLRTSLYAASLRGRVEVVKELLSHGAETTIAIPTSSRETPLYAASSNGHVEVVKELFNYGAETTIAMSNLNGETPLNTASYHGHVDVIKVLLDHGAETSMEVVDEYHETPLFAASSRGKMKVVKQLFNYGAERTIVTRNSYGNSPLYAASSGGYIKIVQELLHHGADNTIMIPNKAGETPLYAAAMGNHIEVFKLLLSISPALVDQENYHDCTPLFVASRFGNHEMVEFLLSIGSVDQDFKNWTGLTALFAAVANGHLEVAKLLVSRGAIISSLVTIGQSLLWWAQRTGNPGLIELLNEEETTAAITAPDACTRYAPPPDIADPVIFDPSLGWCDVCTLSVEDGWGYECVECDHSCFLVCSECFDRGFQLCRKFHKLVPE